MSSPQIRAVVNATGNIPPANFTAYRGGWQNEIGTALVDAVYSIRARYNAADPTKGVSGRVRQFRELYPAERYDLSAIVELGEEAIRAVMGNTETGQRPKSVCVVEAAKALTELEPAVITAEDALAVDHEKVIRAYTSVKGLGLVTAEYFLMHLGVNGVKADRMIVRFVNRALATEGLPETTHWSEARDIIIKAFDVDSRGAENLNAFEHGIWIDESGSTFKGDGDKDQSGDDDEEEAEEA